MAEWWFSPPPAPPLEYDPYLFDPYYLNKSLPVLPILPPHAQHSLPPLQPPPVQPPPPLFSMPPPKADNPREIRNKAEKQRRDKLNHSIAELASLVPPVVCSTRKIDKTGILRYTAHYLRAHQYVFDIPHSGLPQFTQPSTHALLSLLNGFLLTTTYRGLIVVASQNINEYLGYNELELLGKSIFSITHEDDRQLLSELLVPRSHPLGSHGELLVPNDQEGRQRVAQVLSEEERCFIIRFIKLGQRSEPKKYVTCQVEGSFRMSDRALQGKNRSSQLVRRVRARGENPRASGNDVVFVGVVRPYTDTFINESALESYRMEYRTRHSIDGEIIQCEQRIALVTGYMMSEVSGVNAMNFIHRDEVRWVIIALKEMYSQCQLFGESCYRLMTKNGQFIYMRTRGRLDVNSSSRAVTSFVCTNTMVDEREGRELIKMMKKRFSLQANSAGNPAIEEIREGNDCQAVEDPKQLQKEILNMVTTLPSADETDSRCESPTNGEYRLALIPPKKERIVSAIEKIYTVIKTIPKYPTIAEEDEEEDEYNIVFNNIMFPFQENLSTIPEEIPQDDYDELIDAMIPSTYLVPPTDPPNLLTFDELLEQNATNGTNAQTQNLAAYNPVVLSNDSESVMTNTRREQMTLDLTAVAESSQPEMEFESTPSTSYVRDDVPAEPFQVPSEPGPSGSGTGVKRARSEDPETSCKKEKKTSVETNATSEELPVDDTPAMETFYEEHVFRELLESALETSDETTVITIPEFLSSGEVDEFLTSQENGPNNE